MRTKPFQFLRQYAKTRKVQTLTRKEILLIIAPLLPVWIFRIVARYPTTALDEMFVTLFPWLFTIFYLASTAACHGSKLKTRLSTVMICALFATIMGHIFMPMP